MIELVGSLLSTGEMAASTLGAVGLGLDQRQQRHHFARERMAHQQPGLEQVVEQVAAEAGDYADAAAEV